MPDRLKQVVASEPSGGTWHKVSDPTTGWLASKTSGWTPDSFSGGLTVDFSAGVPAGTKAVRVLVFNVITASTIYWRKGSDGNISNTPHASAEVSHLIMTVDETAAVCEIWLSASYTADFAASEASGLTDLYLAYPVEYML
jgi:hypothetical protein